MSEFSNINEHTYAQIFNFLNYFQFSNKPYKKSLKISIEIF